MNWRNAVLGAIAVTAAPACQREQAGEEVLAEATATATPFDAEAEVMPSGTQAFIDATAASDVFEIESSRLALSISRNGAVRSFAQMIIDDHAKSSLVLREAVTEAGPPRNVTPALTPELRADLEDLRAAGDGFNSLYKQQQIAGHEKALALLQSYAASGESGPLRDFASQTAPVVSAHLDQARKLP